MQKVHPTGSDLWALALTESSQTIQMNALLGGSIIQRNLGMVSQHMAVNFE